MQLTRRKNSSRPPALKFHGDQDYEGKKPRPRLQGRDKVERESSRQKGASVTCMLPHVGGRARGVLNINRALFFQADRNRSSAGGIVCGTGVGALYTLLWLVLLLVYSPALLV